MKQDIVDKLRGVGGIESGILYSRRSMLNEAADLIGSLRSRAEKAEAALNECQRQAVKDGNEIARLKAWQDGAISCREAEEARISDYKDAKTRAEATCEKALFVFSALKSPFGYDNQMKDHDVQKIDHALNAAREDCDQLRNLADRLKLEAQGHAMEARTANGTIAECYQLVTGGKGEPGNWHGAEPVRQYVARMEATCEKLEAERDEARADQQQALDLCAAAVDDYNDALATCEKLAKALEPFANEATSYDPPEGDDRDVAWASDFTIGALRVALSCLSEYRKEASE